MAKEKDPVAATRAVTVPAPEDLKHAEDDALLQLRIGRSAHLYTVIVSALLGLDGLLLLYIQPSIGSIAPGQWGGAFYVLLPVVAGVALAATGLVSKWEEYALWPWELHFSVSVGALGVNAVLLAVVGLHVSGYGAFASLSIWPWIFPASLGGISLALIGLVLTWTGWSTRQWASAVAAVLPLATGLLLLFPPKGGNSTDDLLAIALFISAIFYQSSGSFLHLISSGTRTHERELITSGQTKMFHLAEELRGKEEALHFREQALVKREAAAENDEMSIQRQNASLKDARDQLDVLEADYRTRSDAVVSKEREWAGKEADFDNKSRQLEDRSKELELREQEVQRVQPQISTREARLVEKEGEMTKREVELTQRQQDLDRRTAALPEAETRLEARRKELDQKTNDLLRREGELSAREAPSGASTDAAATEAAVAGGAAADLAAREIKLQQFKAVLDEQNLLLGRKARDTADRAKQLDAAQQASAAKEADLATREAALQQREATLADETKATTDRRTQYDSVLKEYESRSAAISKTQVEAAQKSADVDRAQKALADRESAIAAREARVNSARAEIDAREARVNARERAVQSSESEAGLRRVGAGRLPDEVAASAAAGVAAVGVRDLAGESTPVSETLRPATSRRIADRLPTGTPRLDDLLLGGLPPRSHTVLVGDPFVGKEVALYAFLAEGLRRGEPVVLITAARPPTEVTEALGVVLPQFREYEQKGLVTWIDASGNATGTPGANRLIAKGSDDRAGILSAMVKAAKSATGDQPVAFRVGFLGLSAVLAHGDERASFSFLQNVVGILKPRNALAMYSLEPGALSETQLETLLSRMDGAFMFKQDRDKTFLSVKGLGEVQTRDWIECRATGRGLIVGSFALERIR
jgi:KaiC/GvpD/RAD55 family RecA-like ATPase/uncharacterized protein (DUF3084 family)